MAQETIINAKAGEEYVIQAPTGQKISHNYNTGRTRIRVKVSGTYVAPNPPPTGTAPTNLDIIASPSTGIAPLAVQFTAQATGATSYSWNVGQGAFTGTGTTFNVTFPAADTWTVVLTATNQYGSATRTESIVVSPPVEPPPPPPPTGGIEVPAGTGLAAAVANAPAGSTLLLRGGTHTLSGQITTSKKITIQNYPNEVPVITSSSTVRQNYLYFTGDGQTARGLTFKSGSGIFHDSMGSALAESDGSTNTLFEDCTFIGHANLDDHQQLLYQRFGTNITVRRCTFIGNGTQGFGFHQYPGTQDTRYTGPVDPNTLVVDCSFEGFGSGAAGITTDSRITVRNSSFKNCSRCGIQLRNNANVPTGSILENNHDLGGVTLRVENPSKASVNTWS